MQNVCIIDIRFNCIFDLDNPEKAVEIPTLPGCMHKANTYYDEEQVYSFETSSSSSYRPTSD